MRLWLPSSWAGGGDEQQLVLQVGKDTLETSWTERGGEQQASGRGTLVCVQLAADGYARGK